MASEINSPQLSKNEDNELISSERVDGTVVYNGQGDKLGSIHHIMVGKRDGVVRYAVLSFGGLFGIGSNYYPIPWQMLSYATDRAGYVIDLDGDVLANAPSYGRDAEPSWDPDYDKTVHTHYDVRQHDPFESGIRGVTDDYRS